jgi:hypothetical protein
MDDVYEAFRKAEFLVLPAEEKELIDFFKPLYYKIENTCAEPAGLHYMRKFDRYTAASTCAKYIWSGEPLDEQTRAAVRPGVVIIEGRDIKEEYIVRFMRNCSI